MNLADSFSRVVTIEEAALRAAEARAAGGVVVTTNGCFDILHAGHVSCLETARGFGDLLIVGVNTDESVRALKGKGRPVNPLLERMRVLAGLRSVDLVCPFAELTPDVFLRAVRPRVHVKGGDYRVEELAEREVLAELGARVELAPPLGGRSTTSLLARIGELLDTGQLP
jgi:D-beta-D-heptose 7-phosphate kinase / D-beta-D-heptose 1-phosphate adenosyltransferase